MFLVFNLDKLETHQVCRAVVWAGGEQQPAGLQEAECIGPGLHQNVSSPIALSLKKEKSCLKKNQFLC